MKKISIILIMIGFVLPSWAQLGYRTISDKNGLIRNLSSTYMVGELSDFESQLGSDSSIFVNYLENYFKLPYSIRNFVVKNQINNRCETYSGYHYWGGYSTNGQQLEKWQNGYYVILGLLGNHHLTFLDKNFNFKLKVESPRYSTIRQIPTSEGGFVIASGDSLFKLNSSLQRIWAIKLKAAFIEGSFLPYIKEYDNHYFITVSNRKLHCFFVDKATGSITNSFSSADDFTQYRGYESYPYFSYADEAGRLLTVEKMPAINYFNEQPYSFYYQQDGLIILSDKNIVKVNFQGQEAWRIPYDFMYKTLEDDFLVRYRQGTYASEFSTIFYETKGKFAKFNKQGQLLWETPFSEEFAGVEYYPLPKGSFVTRKENNPQGTEITWRMYNSQGQKQWEISNPSREMCFNHDGSFWAFGDFSYKGKLINFSREGKQEWVFSQNSGATNARIIKIFSNRSLLVSYTQFNQPTGTYVGKIALIAAEGQPLFDEIQNGIAPFITKEKHLLVAAQQQLYLLGEDGKIIEKTAINDKVSLFQHDYDGNILMMTYQDKEGFLKDRPRKRYALTKMTNRNRPLWRIDLPFDSVKNEMIYYQLVNPIGKEAYEFVLYKLYYDNVNSIINWKGDAINFLKITRPCYEQVNATLKTTQTSLCSDQKIQLTSNTDSLGFLSYEWQRDGQPLTAAKQSVFDVTAPGTYRVLVRDSVCGTASLSAPIQIKPTPEAVVTPEISGVVYAPFKAKLRANEGIGLTYQWLKEGVELSGATGSVYEAGESGNYAVRVSREGCSQLSQTVGITILQPLGIEMIGAEEFKVFPNPNRGDFELRLPRDWERAEIQLVDLVGRCLPIKLVGTQLRVEAAAGVYWLRVRLAEKELSKQVVIVPF